MKTDWNLIRNMMAAAIDSCEKMEVLGYAEAQRAKLVKINGNDVSAQDIVTSACSYPELLRYQIIRQRHDANADLPYVPETARIIVAMATACAELIDAAEAKPAQSDIEEMISWYREHALPHLEKALAT
jgi:hypothetical protein